MNVKLINYTNNALDLLLYTKSTRLQGKLDISTWSEEKKMEHFDYMLDTIQSSFEFVDYAFEISGVPRSFTHQLVRTRTGSYAQESQRTVDVRGADCNHPYQASSLMDEVFETYGDLIDAGVQVQDAREILPIGTHTSIIAKFNLRSIHDMALLRLCTRTGGTYQEVFKEMKKRIIEVHPWAEKFIKVHCAWYGTCAFPRYTECPIQVATINVTSPIALAKAKVKCDELIGEITHVANPVVKGGMTQ